MSKDPTVPDGVSLVGSFGISDLKGNWQTLDIRHHKVQLVSDSVTEAKYTDNVSNLTTLADQQVQLQQTLTQLGVKECQQAELLKEKKILEMSGTQPNIDAKNREITEQQQTITRLEQELDQCKTSLETEKNNVLNYWCKLVCRVNEAWICRIYTQSKGLLYADVGANGNPYYTNNKFKFVATSDGYYRIVSMYENRALFAGSQEQVYGGVEQGYHYEWKPEKFDGDYYLIYHRSTGQVLDRGGGDYGVTLWTKHGENHQQWKIIPVDDPSNNNIANAQAIFDNKNSELERAQQRLNELERELSLLNLSQNDRNTRLGQINTQLAEIETELNTLNTNFIDGVKTTQQTPQTMPPFKTDNRGLVTQGAVLGFVRPLSRLSAIETCEGNVQLSYFDAQGRMRQTNFDATSDSNNATFEQWIPDNLRTCLNFNNANSKVILEPPVYLGEEWTIEAWFFYPLAGTSDWNTLTRGKDADHHILVKRESNAERLGVYINQGNVFLDSGYDMKQLSPGWHHLTAVAQGKDKEAKTTFYINGQKVGESKGKTTSNVYAIGNHQEGTQQFGKVAEVRIWHIALSAEEIAVNSKTLLTGNEPGLLAYYPFNEATGTTVKDKTGNGYNGTIQGATWWGCAAPIGNLGHQVMQFDGVDDYINIPHANAISFSKDQNFTIEAWIKVDPTQQDKGQANDEILGKWLSGRGYPYNIRYLHQQGTVIVARYDGSNNPTIKSKAIVNDGRFHHVAFVKMGYDLLLYIDGDSSTKGGTTRDTTTGNTNNEDSLYLGCGGARSNFFKGQIADVRIWNKSRTQQEIQADMNQRLTGKESGLVAYYPLNSVILEGSITKVLDLVVNNHNGTVNGSLLVPDQTLPIGSNALVSCEYSTVSKDRTAMMRRFFASPTSKGVNLLPDKRIEQLELKWIGNGQFAPTLLGYIEGAPPIPSENLTLEEGYDSATSVELTLSEDVTFNWTRSQDSGLGETLDTFVGLDTESYVGIGGMIKTSQSRVGAKVNLDTSYQFQNESSITASSSLSMTDKIQLVGTQEQNANFPHLGKRFIPKNVGYALVVSALADVFVTRLKRTGTMIGYQTLPVENIPPNVNTITFLINPAYTMSGSLDGMTGSSATSQRFFKHVPQMRSQFGSLYPASYYRLQEAYDLKQQIEQQDKEREAYFAQFDTYLAVFDPNSQIDKGNAPTEISVNRPEDQPDNNLTEEQKKAAEAEKRKKLEQETKAAQDKQSDAAKKKQAEIDKTIKDQEKRSHATASFAAWQKKMEDIQIRAGKRNIVNTYVWDADGGLRAEAQSFANTAEHSIGGSFSLNAGLGLEGQFGVFGTAVELTAQATVSLTQTMKKTETRSKGIQLNVDLSGVEGRGVTDYNDYPILPGEKVNRYRFMSFYLEGSTNNFHDFFNYVVDPEWLASNGEEARALRQAKGKANKAWRVLHRVTYVERPALMGFGRDVRQLPPADSTTDLGQLQAKIDKLEQENNIIQRKLDTILNKLNS